MENLKSSPKGQNGRISRRDFVRGAAAAAAFTIVPRHVLGGPGQIPPSEKLNIAVIGAGGRGGDDIKGISTENIVALCDVDDRMAANAFNAYPQAKKYRDFRKMLEKEKNIDAVLVATPDHTHAVAAMMAIKMGKHVFCEKPLAHSIYEVRKVTEAARENKKVQTQMGNQGHSAEHIRMLCEWIADGAIGKVTEVHAWSDRPVGGQPWSDFLIMARPKDTPPVPSTLDWDLWLGPAQFRPYNPDYCPTKWRSWWDFGCGALGDMGCHILDPAFWALKLGHPTVVQATTTHWEPGVSSETFPRASIVRYEFPARGDLPAVKLTWYDGRLKPPIPDCFESNRRLGNNGAILIGEKAAIIHDSHGASGLRIVPESKMREYKLPPKTIPRVENGDAGHEQDWIRACKDGIPASANFDYGGPLTEMVLLGVVAMRVKDQRLQWDGENMKFTNNEQANEFVQPPYREGWTL
ncbi:MAG: Gfo/Idh/MocA family oxidoreductase [Sedimentisphaerales bacterium]